jgi:hypothetical protein
MNLSISLLRQKMRLYPLLTVALGRTRLESFFIT